MPIERAAVNRFKQDGFLAIPQLADAGAVAELGKIYDAMLSGEIDVTPTDNPLGMITRQIMLPSLYHEIFRSNPALDAARDIAKDLLETDNLRPVFDMLIYKEPGQAATTPWHQDFSYSAMPFAPAGVEIPSHEVVQFWLALDDVDEQNGCMHFIPAAHTTPMLEHYIAGGAADYSQRLLAIRDPQNTLDLSTAVACPLKAGGATVHNYGTPHFTSGNTTTNRRRRAYIFNFTSKPPVS